MNIIFLFIYKTILYKRMSKYPTVYYAEFYQQTVFVYFIIKFSYRLSLIYSTKSRMAEHRTTVMEIIHLMQTN